MHSRWLRVFALAALASSIACSADVEPTDSSTDALIRHEDPNDLVTTIQKVCGLTVTKGGCIKSITYETHGAYSGSSVTLTGYFEPVSVVTIDGVPATVTTDTSVSNPTHIVLTLPLAAPGPHVLAVVSNGTPDHNEVTTQGPLNVNYLAPFVDAILPNELPAGTFGYIDVGGQGLVDGMTINIGSLPLVLKGCKYVSSTSQCFMTTPGQSVGTYPVFLNSCPSTGECYSQSGQLTYAVACNERYLRASDGSVFDLNTGKTWFYKGQDTEQYCLADYGCASPSPDDLRLFFMTLGNSCASASELSAFPRGKYWSSSATRTGEDTYTAMYFDSSIASAGIENGENRHGCICAQ